MSPKLKMIMNDWRRLNENLRDLKEREVEEMLDYERGGPRRKIFMTRLHQRLNTLRVMRERKAL